MIFARASCLLACCPAPAVAASATAPTAVHAMVWGPSLPAVGFGTGLECSLGDAPDCNPILWCGFATLRWLGGFSH